METKKQIKKYLVFLLCICMILPSAACSEEGASNDANMAEDGGYDVGDDSVYLATMLDYAEENEDTLDLTFLADLFGAVYQDTVSENSFTLTGDLENGKIISVKVDDTQTEAEVIVSIDKGKYSLDDLLLNGGFVLKIDSVKLFGEEELEDDFIDEREYSYAMMDRAGDDNGSELVDIDNAKISQDGAKLIAQYEGCHLQAYLIPPGIWAIGYGHTAGVRPGDVLQHPIQAMNLLLEDLKTYENYVIAAKKSGKIGWELTQNQFDALVSFTFCCGNGNLIKLVSGRTVEEVADQITKYILGGGQVNVGYTRWRQSERDLLLK